MPTQNVNLTDHQHNLIRELTNSGRYQNASEVVRAGLRLLENEEDERNQKVERLREAIQLGQDAIDRGEYIELKTRQDIRDYIDGIRSGEHETIVREKDAEY